MHVVNIADTGVFRGVGKPQSEKYDALRQAVIDADTTLLLPRDIYAELGGDPTAESFPSGSAYVDTAIEEGWVEIADELRENSPISDARTDANTVIANQANHPKTFIAAEDTALIGLAIQLFEANETIKIILHTTDRPVAKAAVVVVPEYGYHEIRAEYTPPNRVHEKTAKDFTWE